MSDLGTGQFNLNSDITSIDLSAQTYVSDWHQTPLSFPGASGLTTIIFPSTGQNAIGGPSAYALTGLALSAATVDAFFNFMAQCYAVSSFTATLNTSGGTSAAPTAASLTARNTLTTAGCTIITN